MKKIISLILALLLLLAFPGCAEEDEGPRVYAKPTFTPGTLESDLLKAEPGNYQRCADTNDLRFVEIESGYYMVNNETVWYADHTNLDAWFRMCADPKCSHDPLLCSAELGGNGMCIVDDRLWFTSYYGIDPLSEGGAGIYLVSTEKNGNDRRWEYSLEEEKNNMPGGSLFMQVCPGGFLFAANLMEPDGSYRGVIYLVDKESGPKKIFEEIYQDRNDARASMSENGKNRFTFGLNGDLCILSMAFSDTYKKDQVLCWFRDGEPVFSDISQVSIKGAYLSGGILRVFLPGDGYYDLDLLTGKMTRLADAQLSGSGAMILQPNCIIESTLLDTENRTGAHRMRLFDGQQWHTVTLPEDLASTEEAPFHVVAVTSDRVVFRQSSSYKDSSVPIMRENITFYQIKLDGDGYILEYMGVNQFNRQTNESWFYN